MTIFNLPMVIPARKAWNHGRIIGQKRPLLPKHVWAIRVRLELAGAIRELALFNLAIDSKFEITGGTRKALVDWIGRPLMTGHEYLWPGRFRDRQHISTRQYARLVKNWVQSIGLEPSAYGTHSLRRTKVAEIYRKTGNLRAVQLLLGHTKMDSTVRYLGVELEDALSISESVEI